MFVFCEVIAAVFVVTCHFDCVGGRISSLLQSTSYLPHEAKEKHVFKSVN